VAVPGVVIPRGPKAPEGNDGAVANRECRKESVVTGPGDAIELLKRSEVLIPEKLKFITRKSNLQKPI
jgi:hypothetical protein